MLRPLYHQGKGPTTDVDTRTEKCLARTATRTIIVLVNRRVNCTAGHSLFHDATYLSHRDRWSTVRISLQVSPKSRCNSHSAPHLALLPVIYTATIRTQSFSLSCSNNFIAFQENLTGLKQGGRGDETESISSLDPQVGPFLSSFNPKFDCKYHSVKIAFLR